MPCAYFLSSLTWSGSGRRTALEPTLKAVMSSDSSSIPAKPAHPLKLSMIDRFEGSRPHYILDVAEKDLSAYCSSLAASEASEQCRIATGYFRSERARAEDGCELEGKAGMSEGPACNKLEVLEKYVRELMGLGSVRSLVRGLEALARVEGYVARNATGVAEAQARPPDDSHMVKDNVTRKEELRRLFEWVDSDGDQRIDAAQFREAMNYLGDEDLSGDIVATMFDALDIHGFLDLDQFVTLVEAEEDRSHSQMAAVMRHLKLRSKWWSGTV